MTSTHIDHLPKDVWNSIIDFLPVESCLKLNEVHRHLAGITKDIILKKIKTAVESSHRYDVRHFKTLYFKKHLQASSQENSINLNYELYKLNKLLDRHIRNSVFVTSTLGPIEGIPVSFINNTHVLSLLNDEYFQISSFNSKAIHKISWDPKLDMLLALDQNNHTGIVVGYSNENSALEIFPIIDNKCLHHSAIVNVTEKWIITVDSSGTLKLWDINIITSPNKNPTYTLSEAVSVDEFKNSKELDFLEFSDNDFNVLVIANKKYVGVLSSQGYLDLWCLNRTKKIKSFPPEEVVNLGLGYLDENDGEWRITCHFRENYLISPPKEDLEVSFIHLFDMNTNTWVRLEFKKEYCYRGIYKQQALFFCEGSLYLKNINSGIEILLFETHLKNVMKSFRLNVHKFLVMTYDDKIHIVDLDEKVMDSLNVRELKLNVRLVDKVEWAEGCLFIYENTESAGRPSFKVHKLDFLSNISFMRH